MHADTPAHCIGCITGTSVDGLDLALVRFAKGAQSFGADIQLLASHTEPLPRELRKQLLELGQPGDNELDRLGTLDAQLGTFIGESINKFIHASPLTPEQIDAIGSHGQTVRHRPEQSPHWTLQIGDPTRIAEVTGIMTIADFRRADIAAGGQGAPLVPPLHAALLSQAADLADCAVLNIGGIANLTTFDNDQAQLGFDTGPGNGLMDNWVNTHLAQPYDAGGALAASGTVDDDLLSRMLADPYFDKPPPKSTGREYFNAQWLAPFLDAPRATNDTLATLAELTATSVERALAANAPQTKHIYVCGGGGHNAHLMRRLAAQNQQRSVHGIAELGVDGDSLEAVAFAWLAARRLANLPGNAPSVTGAQGLRVLGALYPAPQRQPIG